MGSVAGLLEESGLAMSETKRLKVALEVTAGLVPGDPMPEYTKVWYLSREEYEDLDTYLAAGGAAILYALTLQDPARLNWVRFEWVWT